MTKTQTLTTEQKLEQLLLQGLTSKGAYKQAFQEWLGLFIGEYDKSLNKNSKPLFDFLKRLDNVERVKISMYLKACTSLESVIVTDKGCKIKLKSGADILKITDTSLKWYDMKISVKPVEYNAERLKKSLDNLLKHYDKQALLDVLSTL